MRTAILISQAFAAVALSALCASAPAWPAARDGFGLIPLAPVVMPASDLVYHDGSGARVLTPEEAWSLQENKVDLSLLDPDETTDLWKNRLAEPLDQSVDALALSSDDTVAYESPVKSMPGRFRFNVSKDAGGAKETFRILMTKRLHSILLVKGLLRKLGYQVPPMRHLSRLRLRFQSVKDKQYFIKVQIPQNTEGAATRWVVEEPTDSPETLVLQDVVAMASGADDYYNLALGVPPEQLRLRVFRSLLLVYGLLDVKESINKVDWGVGRVSDGSVEIPNGQYADFNCSMDDARWIMRRLARLSRDDFREIVEAAAVPMEARLLLTEKLISRRNSLLKILPDGSSLGQPIPVNDQVSYGEFLKKGKLLRTDWPGYATRFSHGDQESPFEDIEYLIAGKIESSVIDGLVKLMNAQLFSVDFQKKIQEHIHDQVRDRLVEYFTAGKMSDVPLGVWPTPTGSVQGILSRDIITGTYMGSDSLIQLADTVGVTASAGYFLLAEGLPSLFSGSGAVSASATRTYTHLKPLNNFKRAIEEPSRNMLVPLLKLQAAQTLDKVADSANSLNDDEREMKLSGLMETLDQSLGIGESIVITQSVGAQGRFGITAGLGNFHVSQYLQGQVGATLAVAGSGTILWRLHIHRKSAETIQVYRDLGNVGGLQLAFEIRGLIPILSISGGKQKGTARTHMYTLNVGADIKRNPELHANALALEQVLKNGSTELLDDVTKPYGIKTSFKDGSTNLKFLWWQYRGLNAKGAIAVETPEKKTASYLHFTHGSQWGANYQGFAMQAANLLSDIFIDPKYADYVKIRDLPIPNPGQSIFGKGQTVSSEFESEIVGAGNAAKLREPFIRLTHRWEGWSIDKRRAQELIDQLTKQYGFPMYSSTNLAGVDVLKLYSVSVYLNVYARGLMAAAAPIDGERKRIIDSYIERFRCEEYWASVDDSGADRPRRSWEGEEQQTQRCDGIDDYRRGARDYREQESTGKVRKQGQALLHVMEGLHEALNPEDFIRFLGGRDNLYVHGQINGFRSGSEALSEPILSNTFGRIGSKKGNGPLDTVKSMLGIMEGEFEGSWLRDRL